MVFKKGTLSSNFHSSSFPHEQILHVVLYSMDSLTYFYLLEKNPIIKDAKPQPAKT